MSVRRAEAQGGAEGKRHRGETPPGQAALRQVNPYDDRVLEYLKAGPPGLFPRLRQRSPANSALQASIGKPVFGRQLGAHPFQPVLLRPGERKLAAALGPIAAGAAVTRRAQIQGQPAARIPGGLGYYQQGLHLYGCRHASEQGTRNLVRCAAIELTEVTQADSSLHTALGMICIPTIVSGLADMYVDRKFDGKPGSKASRPKM